PGQPGDVGTALHVRYRERDGLVLLEPAAEGLALLGIPYALVHAALGQAGGQRGDRHPALIQDLEELRVAAASFAQEICRRNPASGERKLPRVGRAPPDFGILGPRGEARSAVLDND